MDEGHCFCGNLSDDFPFFHSNDSLKSRKTRSWARWPHRTESIWSITPTGIKEDTGRLRGSSQEDGHPYATDSVRGKSQKIANSPEWLKTILFFFFLYGKHKRGTVTGGWSILNPSGHNWDEQWEGSWSISQTLGFHKETFPKVQQISWLETWGMASHIVFWKPSRSTCSNDDNPRMENSHFWCIQKECNSWGRQGNHERQNQGLHSARSDLVAIWQIRETLKIFWHGQGKDYNHCIKSILLIYTS